MIPKPNQTKTNWSLLANASEPISYSENRWIKKKNQAFIVTFLHELHRPLGNQIVDKGKFLVVEVFHLINTE